MITEVKPVTTRYRRHPRPFKDSRNECGQAVLEKRCERTKGHVLTVTAKGIECTNCGAEWHDYGH